MVEKWSGMNRGGVVEERCNGKGDIKVKVKCRREERSGGMALKTAKSNGGEREKREGKEKHERKEE